MECFEDVDRLTNSKWEILRTIYKIPIIGINLIFVINIIFFQE